MFPSCFACFALPGTEAMVSKDLDQQLLLLVPLYPNIPGHSLDTSLSLSLTLLYNRSWNSSSPGPPGCGWQAGGGLLCSSEYVLSGSQNPFRGTRPFVDPHALAWSLSGQQRSKPQPSWAFISNTEANWYSSKAQFFLQAKALEEREFRSSTWALVLKGKPGQPVSRKKSVVNPQ